jgi:hypothetical protein
MDRLPGRSTGPRVSTADGVRPSGEGVTVPGADEVWLDAEVVVNRADFGITYTQRGSTKTNNTLSVHAVLTKSRIVSDLHLLRSVPGKGPDTACGAGGRHGGLIQGHHRQGAVGEHDEVPVRRLPGAPPAMYLAGGTIHAKHPGTA